MQEKIKTFLVHYVNSVDSVSETIIKATNTEEVKRKVKQKFGRNCYRIINIRELVNSDLVASNFFSAFNTLDKLWEDLADPLIEAKADTQRLVDFAGAELACRFFAIKNKLKAPENDLYYWIKNKTVDELEQAISSIENIKSNTQIKKETASQGAALVCETDHWKVYHITTFEAAQAYGRDTHWCITGINAWGDKYWKEYKEKGADFYFFITKGKYNPRGYDSKFALAIYPNNDCEVFNQKDGQCSLLDIKYIYEVNIPGLDLDSLDERGWVCCRCGEFVPEDLVMLDAEGTNCYCEDCWDVLFKR
jgi:hypothetical protein